MKEFSSVAACIRFSVVNMLFLSVLTAITGCNKDPRGMGPSAEALFNRDAEAGDRLFGLHAYAKAAEAYGSALSRIDNLRKLEGQFSKPNNEYMDLLLAKTKFVAAKLQLALVGKEIQNPADGSPNSR